MPVRVDENDMMVRYYNTIVDYINNPDNSIYETGYQDMKNIARNAFNDNKVHGSTAEVVKHIVQFVQDVQFAEYELHWEYKMDYLLILLVDVIEVIRSDSTSKTEELKSLSAECENNHTEQDMEDLVEITKKIITATICTMFNVDNFGLPPDMHSDQEDSD